MVDKKVGSAGIEITADDSAAMKVFKNLFNGVGKVDDIMKKFGETISFTIEKSEDLGKKTNKTTKNMIDTFNETKKTVESVTKTIGSISKSLDSQSKNTINNYKKTGDGIKDVNKTLSEDTKQTFEEMKASNDDYNKNLIESVKYSTGEFKRSFIELKDSVVGMAKNIGSAIISAVKKPVEVIQSIPNAARTMGQKVTGFFASGFGQAKDLAISQLEKVKSGINNIPNHARNASNRTKDFFVTGFNSMTLGASSAMSKTARFINELPSRTRQSANNLKTNFVQKIKDIPKSASEMATNVKDKFVSMSESARATGGKVKSFFSNSFNHVKDNAKEAIDNSKNKIKELDGASEKASISIGKISGAFLLLKAGTKIIGAITSSLDSAISRFDTMTKYPKVMQALGFGADQSKKSIDALSAGIDGLPTKLDDIVGINQRMISVSGNIDLATNATIGLNNAFLASGATTDEAARGMDQYIKMLATGKVEGDSWQTLMETMPVSLSKVANALGYVGNSAMIDLQKAMQDGEVTFDQFQEKIIELGTGTGELADLAKINSEGIATSFGNIRNAISKGVGNVIAELDRLSKKFTDSTIAKHIDNLKAIINKSFASIISNMEPLAEKIFKLKNILQPLLPLIYGVLGGLAAYGTLVSVIGVINQLKNAFVMLFGTMLTNPIVIVLAALVGLVTILATAYKKSETFRNAVDKLSNSLKNGLGKTISFIQSRFSELSNVLKTVLGQSLEYAGKKFTDLGRILGKTIGRVTDTFKALKAVATGEITKEWELFKFSPAIVDSSWVDTIMEMGKKLEPLATAFQTAEFAIKGFFAILSGKHTESYALLDFIPKNVDVRWTEKIYNAAKKLEPVKVFFKTFGDVMKGFFAIITGDVSNYAELFSKLHDSLSIKQIDGLYEIMLVFQKLKESVVSSLDGIFEAIGKAFGGDFGPLIEMFSNLLPKIMMALIGGAPYLLYTGAKLITKLADGMGISIPQLLEKVVSIITKVIEKFSEILPKVLTVGIGILEKIVDGIVQTLPAIIGTVILFLSTLVQLVTENLPILLDAGIKMLTAIIEGIVSILPSLIDSALTIILTLFNVLIENLPMIIDAGIKILITLINAVISMLPTLIAAAIKIIVTLASAIIDNLPVIIKAGFDILVAITKGLLSAIGELLKALPQIFKAIFDAFAEVDWLSLGTDIIKGVIKGISDMAGAVKDAVGKVTDGIKGWFKEKLDIHSPSRVMAKISQWIPIGVAKGISDKAGTVKNAVQNMGSVVSKTFETAQTVVNVADPIINNQTQTPDVQTDMNLGTQFTDVLSNDIPDVFNVGSELGSAVSDGIDSTAIEMNQSGNDLMTMLNTVLSKYFPQMSQTGKSLLQNVINGFSSLFVLAQGRAFNIGQLMVANVNKHQTNMRNAGLSLMNSLATGIKNGQGVIQSAIRNINGEMLNGISKGINGVLTGVNFVLSEVGSDRKLPSWKIPAYAKGTDGHPFNGPALVNDARDSNWQEAYQTPDGRVGLFPRIKNLIANLPKGTKVMSGRTVAKMNILPAYKDGIGDFDIVDLLDGPDAFRNFIDKRVNFDGVKEPWLNMSKSATKLMTGEAFGLVKSEMDKFFSHGTFDGAMNANNVYQYLVDVAQKLMGKFPGLTVTSGYRPGDPYYHGKHQALDLAYPGVVGDSRYKTIADYAFNKFPKQIGYVITLGKVRDRLGLSGTGSSGSWVNWPDNDHFDHIHLNGAMGSGDIFTGSGDTGGMGGVERWRSLAIKALKMEGQYSASNLNAMMNQMRTESGGNPRAINNWDINAINGDPSKGLLQVIGSTFRAHARAPFNKDIYDPLSNMLASIRYAVSRYGSLTAAYRGVGYENGGLITQDGLYRAGEGNKAEMVIPLTKPKRAMELIMQSLKYMGMSGMEFISNIPNVASNLMTNMSDKLNSVKNFSLDNLFDSVAEQLGTLTINVLGGSNSDSSNTDLSEIISLLRQIASGVGNGTVVVNMDGKRVSRQTAPHTDNELARRGRLEERGVLN
ncbi:tape measure protein [Vagococcus fluvialis]|uniref:tape measure protein n=1 Tax=Vagococcus fluvialis TaxID=2738 RepID=UPI003B20E218